MPEFRILPPLEAKDYFPSVTKPAVETRSRREIFFDRIIKPIVGNPLVAQAFQTVDRRNFVPQNAEYLAYTNKIISIGDDSSMSEPTLMAIMLDMLELSGSEKTLEIGTASGYNAALLSRCCAEVYTIEHNPELAKTARIKLDKLGYLNVDVLIGDGALGIPTQAPFDRIILTAAVFEFPQLLFDQLKDGGIVVAPIGQTLDTLRLAIGKKEGNTLHLQYGDRVGFIPLYTSEHGGWSETAKEKTRSYALIESGTIFEFPQVPHADLVGDEENVGGPTQECLELLKRYGLTEEEFLERFREMGDRARVLLTLHPEAFESLLKHMFFVSQLEETDQSQPELIGNRP